MESQVPSYFQLLHDRPAIAARVRELGREITGWALSVSGTTGKDLICIPLLRGGVFFFADLVREIQCSIEMTPIRTCAYRTDENVEASSVSMHVEDLVAKDRSILIVDDICDSGRTLHHLSERLISLGAREVKSVVMIKRELPDAFEPDWCGFRHQGPEWMVGYGMDDRDRWRNLPSIYLMKR